MERLSQDGREYIYESFSYHIINNKKTISNEILFTISKILSVVHVQLYTHSTKRKDIYIWATNSVSPAHFVRV